METFTVSKTSYGYIEENQINNEKAQVMMKSKPLAPIKRVPQFLLILTMIAATISCGDENREAPVETIETEVEGGADIGAVEWNYENTNWETLENNECSSNVQSPVDIDTQNVIEADLDDIQYEYEPFQMSIVDNGHTVQVQGSDSNYITVEGKRYQFRQFHFHNPSEHTLDGKQFPLEMHLVHQETGTDNLVVLGVFIEEGSSNAFLEDVFRQIPSEKKVEIQTQTMINLSNVIPPAQMHYTYIGSLTTPPCTVGVDWIVFKEPIAASSEQIQRFTDVYANSARPVQPLKNRRVLKSME